MEVSIKCSHIIKPLEPTYRGVYQLSDWDQIGMITHVPTIYFYKPSKKWLTSSRSIIGSLKESLSRVLVHFYFLAGRVHWIGKGRLELNCNAMGVELIEAESSNNKLSDFGDFGSQTYLFENLVPFIDYSKPINELPLVVAQLTKFKCGGICLGMNISHVIGDGQSALHFMSEWARLARGEALKVAPYFDPNIFRAQYLPRTRTHSNFFLSDNYQIIKNTERRSDNNPRTHSNNFKTEFKPPTLLTGQENNLKKREKGTTISILPLSNDFVQSLKTKVTKGFNGNIVCPYTRYEVVAAHVWICACKARKHLIDQQTCLSFSVDVRNRVHPPLPQKYFGNASLDIVVSCRSSDIVTNTLAYVCAKIRGAIEKVNNEYVLSNIEFWKNMSDLSPFQDLITRKRKEDPNCGNQNLEVISWLTLPLYGLDFGWGKEIYMGPGTHDSDGDCLILPDSKNDGSVKVAICLQVEHMDAFKKHFYMDILCKLQGFV